MKYKISIIVAGIVVIASTTSALAADASQTLVKLDLSQDLITFLTFAIWCGGIFIAILAALGVAFFGFDVRKARSSIMEMTSELRGLIDNAKKEHEKLQSVQEELTQLKVRFDATVADAERRIEELGAQIEETTEETTSDASAITGTEAAEPSQEGRSEDELIRELIRGSSFNWTTIGRLKKRTGLSSEGILEQARAMQDIEISTGKKSKDHIFRLKDNG
jgi:F0F1-type ATP synthase membrane subunit b/b'